MPAHLRTVTTEMLSWNEVHISALSSPFYNSSQTCFLPPTYITHIPLPLSNRANHRKSCFCYYENCSLFWKSGWKKKRNIRKSSPLVSNPSSLMRGWTRNVFWLTDTYLGFSALLQRRLCGLTKFLLWQIKGNTCVSGLLTGTSPLLHNIRNCWESALQKKKTNTHKHL